MSKNSPKKDQKSLLTDKQYSRSFDDYEEAIKTDSYLFSSLAENLSLETLNYKDALLLLTGVEPMRAEVKWQGYQNDDGARIDSPKVDNAAFLNPSLPDFDIQTDFSHEGDQYHFIGDKEIEAKINILKEVNARLEFLLKHWQSAANPHADRNSPKYYIDWALSKKYDIPWLAYAIENGLCEPKQQSDNLASDKSLSKRTENNYLRLILTLATSIKGFNPQKPYEAAQLIIDETGTDISKETIAGYISKAYAMESKKRD